MRLLIFVFFCIQLVAVVSHKDPTISNYGTYEDRRYMTESLNLEDYQFRFYVSFVRATDLESVVLDPRIGKFKVVEN